MSSAKDMLRQAIEALTEDQARQVLGFIHGFRRKSDLERIRKAVGNDPAIELPAHEPPEHQPFDPVKGTGIPASKLLVNDRR